TTSASGLSQAQASAVLCIQQHRLNAPTLAYTLRTCCSPAPHPSFTSLKACSWAPRSAAPSRTCTTVASGSVLNRGSQPLSSLTNTTRITPPAGRHVARNVLEVLVPRSPYCTHATCRHPRVCPARLAREIRSLPYVGAGPGRPGFFGPGSDHSAASLRSRLITWKPASWAGLRNGLLA